MSGRGRTRRARLGCIYSVWGTGHLGVSISRRGAPLALLPEEQHGRVPTLPGFALTPACPPSPPHGAGHPGKLSASSMEG